MDTFYEMCVASGIDLDELQEQIGESYMAADIGIFPDRTAKPATLSTSVVPFAA
jgi:hypothetical protein